MTVSLSKSILDYAKRQPTLSPLKAFTRRGLEVRRQNADHCTLNEAVPYDATPYRDLTTYDIRIGRKLTLP